MTDIGAKTWRRDSLLSYRSATVLHCKDCFKVASIEIVIDIIAKDHANIYAEVFLERSK